MFIKLIYSCCILLSFFAYAEESKMLSFDQLKSMDKQFFPLQDIAIRGFLYLTKEKQWILASEPNLKTCCVGSSDKMDQQIVVSGTFLPNDSRHYAVVVQGTIVLEPIYTAEGKLKQVYKLENAHIIEKLANRWPTNSIVIACITMLSLAVFFLISRRKIWH